MISDLYVLRKKILFAALNFKSAYTRDCISEAVLEMCLYWGLHNCTSGAVLEGDCISGKSDSEKRCFLV